MSRINPDMKLTKATERAVEDGWRNDDEAHALLDLIDAEFRTDPMSQQCFDRSIVQRVAYCVALRKKHQADRIF